MSEENVQENEPQSMKVEDTVTEANIETDGAAPEANSQPEAKVEVAPTVKSEGKVEAESKEKVDTKSNDKPKSGKLAVILVRGMVKVTKSVKDTLAMLSLNRKNTCIILEDNTINQGMVKKVKDYVTWGELDEKTFSELIEKRGKEFLARTTDRKEKYNYKFLEVNGKKYKKYFTLNPPRKGFGRKGIKVAFKAGGALGNRQEKINDLIVRML